jgi:eukaryotic-like serine/threonine-protein kinase
MMRPLVSNASDLSDLGPTSPGSVLAGKYRVERILGQGGMGVVVEAKHIALDERVALKFLLPEYAKHPEAATRFLREARAAVKIKSEHVARVSDVGTLETGAPYMVMEFLEGHDLSKLLELQGVLSVLDAVDYVIQGAEAITEAHSYGIVHRDLKPANLFLSKRPDGTPIVKVLDFGISKDKSSGIDNLTKTTAAMGSALYMSPEQMQQTKSVDHRTDVYALGISLYELLAGKQPFFADTLPQLCAEILTGVPTPLRSLRTDVSEQLAAVIERAYARDRGYRFQSVAEFVVALAPFAPPRSLSTIERAARMGGLQVPQSGVLAAPAASPSGVYPAPPAGYPAPPSSPNLAVPPGTFPQQVPAQQAPPSPPGAVTGAAPPPPQQVLGSHQIVPGHYNAPMSVRAAASFAQGGTTNANLSTTGTGGASKLGAFALVGLVLIAMCGIGAAVAFRFMGSKAQLARDAAPAASVTATAAPGPSAPPVDSASTPAPTAAKSADAPPPVDTAAAAASASAAAHKGGKLPAHSIVAPVPVAPVGGGGLGDLPGSVYDNGKHK